MSLRKLLFWVHLGAGLTAGIVIAIMSITGVAIAFEEEILAWVDREVSRIETPAPAGAAPLTVTELTERVEAARPAFKITSATMPRDADAAYRFYAGDEGPLYVDPYTGAMNESRAGSTHEVIHTLEEWHRWLGASDGLTSTARLITGISNLALLVLCATGLYLWFPRRWSRRALRPIVGLMSGYRGKARDYNWHNVFGFWSLPLLALLAATAVPISFTWGHKLVFALAGENAPEARNYGMMAAPSPVVPTPPAGSAPLTVDELFAAVQRAFPEWEFIDMPWPDSAAADPTKPLAAGVTLPDYMPSRAYVPVELDPFTGAVLQAIRFQDRSPGLQARVWIRFLHTGAAFGVPGKIIASLVTAASLVLVWTGFALSWRRFFPRTKQPQRTNDPAAAGL